MEIISAESQNAVEMDSMAEKLDPMDARMVGARLRVAREILSPGGSQADVANLVGETGERWSRIETGETRLSFQLADRLHSLGIERDWLVYGSERLVTAILRGQIEQAESRLADAPKFGRKLKSRA